MRLRLIMKKKNSYDELLSPSFHAHTYKNSAMILLKFISMLFVHIYETSL